MNRTLQRQADGGGLIFLDPKSKRSHRAVDLGDEASVALTAHRERQALERKAAGSGWQEEGLLFSTETGARIDQSRVHRHWRKAIEKAGIPCYRIHDLRHSVATHLMAGGMSAREVAEVLGHSSTSLVLDVYGHVAPTTHRRAADLMDTLLKAQDTAKRGPSAS